MSPAQPEDLGFQMIDQDHICPTTPVSTVQPSVVSKSSPSRLPYNDNAVAGLVFQWMRVSRDLILMVFGYFAKSRAIDMTDLMLSLESLRRHSLVIALDRVHSYQEPTTPQPPIHPCH